MVIVNYDFLISNDVKVYEQTSFGHKNESTSQRAYTLKTVCLCWLALLVYWLVKLTDLDAECPL